MENLTALVLGGCAGVPGMKHDDDDDMTLRHFGVKREGGRRAEGRGEREHHRRAYSQHLQEKPLATMMDRPDPSRIDGSLRNLLSANRPMPVSLRRWLV